jgi:hypothetical protein
MTPGPQAKTAPLRAERGCETRMVELHRRHDDGRAGRSPFMGSMNSATSGVTGRPWHFRAERGFPARAGLSTRALRGFAGMGGGFREPRAGSARDGQLPMWRTERDVRGIVELAQRPAAEQRPLGYESEGHLRRTPRRTRSSPFAAPDGVRCRLRTASLNQIALRRRPLQPQGLDY